MTHNDWSTQANDREVVEMPDELDPLFHKLGMQLRFHTISDKSEGQTLVDMVYIAQKFFTEHPELCKS
jgi:hypothetical protein